MLTNFDDTANILFRGSPHLHTISKDAITEVTLDMSTSQVTELSFTIDDPAWVILGKGWFDIETPVTYRGLKLTVAVIETTPGGGLGGLTVKCRPSATSKLKKQRGDRVVKGVSAASFVASECAAVGVTAVVQSSPTKPRIARDTPQKGQDYDESNHPSSWTTFQRLANELGYLMYEVGGVIYFGKPTWLINQKPKVAVQWYPDTDAAPMSFPQFRQSIDSEDIEVTVELGLDRAGTIFPGYGITFNGVPKYAGTYFVTGVNYPLAGTGTMSVSASTVRNPKPQKSGEEDGTTEKVVLVKKPVGETHRKVVVDE
jgi:hypothetical protein